MSDPNISVAQTHTLILGTEVSFGTLSAPADRWDLFSQANLLPQAGQIEARLYAQSAGGQQYLLGKLPISGGSARATFEVQRRVDLEELAKSGGVSWELRLIALTPEAQVSVTACFVGYSYTEDVANQSLQSTVVLLSALLETPVITMSGQNQFHDASANFQGIDVPVTFRLYATANGIRAIVFEADYPPRLDRTLLLFQSLTNIGSSTYELVAIDRSGRGGSSITATLEGYEQQGPIVAATPDVAIDVESQGIPVAGTPFKQLNFVGGGVVAVPGAPDTVDVTIPGGGGIVVLMGDVNGPSAANVVNAINGSTVPAGPLTVGNVLQAIGAAALTYAAINLAGGVNFVTGQLPTANQVDQAMVGDVTGTTGANIVSKINGSSVPAGPLTTGNVLQATGAATLGYAPVNLAGGANFVSGLLPTANQVDQTMTGDVTGTTGANVVAKINGSSVPAGPLTTGNVLQATGAATLGYAAVNLAGGANFVTGVLPTANQAAQSLAGDATGTTAAVVVVKINGASVPASGALTVGNTLQVIGPAALTYSALNLAGGANFVTGVLPSANQAAQTMLGDVTGTTSLSTVAKINGSTVPVGGGLTTGNVLQVTGAAALSYAAVNLAGGANFVTGVLPSANQAAQTMLGDVTGTTAASVVAKINGATVPAAGALTTGNVLQVNGVSSTTYAPVNLAGGANFVTGVLPTGNQASQTMAGDVTGTTAANTVVTITGSAGVATVASATSLAFATNPAASGRIRMPNNTGINFRNATNTTDIAALTVDSSNVVIVGSAGANFTARLANNGGGATTLEWEAAGTGVNGRHGGNIFFQHAVSGVTDIRSTNGQGITFTSSGSAYTFGGMLTVVWQGSGAHLLQLQNTITGPTWSHQTGAGAGTTWSISAQSAGGSNQNGGGLTLASGAPTGSGTAGSLSLQVGGNNSLVLSGNLAATCQLTLGTTSSTAFALNPTAGSTAGATFTIAGQAAGGSNQNGGHLVLTSGAPTGSGTAGELRLQVNASNSVVITGAAAGTIQLTLGTTSATGFAINPITATAAGSTFTIAGQAAGGASNNGGRVQIQSGARTGTTTSSAVSLQINGTTTMVEAVILHPAAADQRAVVLCRFSDITTTQLPSGTGDGVVYVGDAATTPSADSVSGILLYSNTAVFSFRNGSANGGNRIEFTIISSASATGGGATVPGQAQEFIDITYNGNARKIALFNP